METMQQPMKGFGKCLTHPSRGMCYLALRPLIPLSILSAISDTAAAPTLDMSAAQLTMFNQ